MENLNILERLILSLLYSFPCVYIAIKLFISALYSFKKIMIQDTLANLLSTALYVTLSQLSIITARAFCNMLSVNFIKNDVLLMVTAFFNFCFSVCALCMFFIKVFTCSEEFSIREFLKTAGFRVGFSLIFLQISTRLMTNIVNGIYYIQTSVYEKILEINLWYSEIIILVFSLVCLNTIFYSSKYVPIMFGETDTENIENNDLAQR